MRLLKTPIVQRLKFFPRQHDLKPFAAGQIIHDGLVIPLK